MFAVSNAERACAAVCDDPLADRNVVYPGMLNLPLRDCVKLPADFTPPYPVSPVLI